MRKDLTDITVILDRSGSMANGLNDTIGGLNTFIEEQKKQPGEALFTLIQFDKQYEFVHNGVSIKDVPKCGLVPRGSTALLDAVGRGIVETGTRLGAMPEDQRPGLVMIVIVTDGEENASEEFTQAKIKEMIETQTNVYKWHFSFLGANADAFAQGEQLGTSKGASAQYTSGAMAFAATSQKSSRMRETLTSGGIVLPEDNDYTAEEKALMQSNS